MKKLKIVLGIINMARKPEDYARVVRFREILRAQGYFQFGVDSLLNNEQTKKIMKDKPLLSWKQFNEERLLAMGPGTLGYEFIQFLKKHNLQALDYTWDPKLTDEEYLIRRVVQTHDLWHVILGYSTSELDEIEINSFMLAQMFWPPAGFYLGGYILRQMFKQPLSVVDVVSVIARGWYRGKAAKPFFAVEWENQFERPVSEIRKELVV